MWLLIWVNMRRTDSILPIQFFYRKMSHLIECAAVSFCLFISENVSKVKIASNFMCLTHTYMQQLSGSSTAFSLWPISTYKHGLFVYGHTAANVIRVVDISQEWAWGAVLAGPLSSGEVSDKDCRRLNTPLLAVRRPFLSYLHAVFHREACKESLMSKHFLKLQPHAK